MPLYALTVGTQQFAFTTAKAAAAAMDLIATSVHVDTTWLNPKGDGYDSFSYVAPMPKMSITTIDERELLGKTQIDQLMLMEKQHRDRAKREEAAENQKLEDEAAEGAEAKDDA